jgi:hypothetical protein
MNKTEKIKLLKGVKEGNIHIDKLPLYIASMGLTKVYITLWHEIKPGIYAHQETGRIIKEGESIKDLKPNVVTLKIKLFRENGTRVPVLASSEKDVHLQ